MLENTTRSGFKLSERYTLLEQVYRGDDQQSNPGVHERHWATELTGFVSITPRLTLVGVVPYRKGKIDGELLVRPDGTTVQVDAEAGGSASGIGDVSLLAGYTFWSSENGSGRTRAAALGGVKFPTGRTDVRADEEGEYLDARLQPGTGSTDYVLGLSLGHSLRHLSLSANLLGTIPGEGTFGDTKHRFGRALTCDLAGEYPVYRGALRSQEMELSLVLGVSGELRGRDRLAGAAEENSGGKILYLSPGLQLSLAPHWVLDFTYQQAVSHDLNGTQLTETKKLTGGVTYLF